MEAWFLVLFMATGAPSHSDMWVLKQAFPDPPTCIQFAQDNEQELKYRAFEAYGVAVEDAVCMSKDLLKKAMKPQGESV